MADRWQVERVGMGYRCWAEEIATEIRFEALKRGRETLTGLVTVKTSIDGIKTVNDGVMHVTRINIIAGTARKSLASYLRDRCTGTVAKDLDWTDALEHLAQYVMLAEVEGEAFDEVGESPVTPIRDQFLLTPLVLRGRPTMIFGPGGVGKSLLGLTCGVSVAAGREIIPGVAVHAKGPVLYLDWETTRDVINDRIQMIAKGHGFAPPKILYRRCVRPLADDVEKLSAFVQERGVVLEVIDSAAYAMGQQGEHGSAEDTVLRMHEALRQMGTTSLIIDHVNKTDLKAKPGTATPYGSAYKTNAARMSWEVRKGPESGGESLRINLYHAKSNDTAAHEPIGLELDWGEDAILFREAAVVEPVQERTAADWDGERRSISSVILELTADNGIPRREIAKYLPPDTKPNSIVAAIIRLEEKGRVSVDAQGVVRQSKGSSPQPTLSSITGGMAAKGRDQT